MWGISREVKSKYAEDYYTDKWEPLAFNIGVV